MAIRTVTLSSYDTYIKDSWAISGKEGDPPAFVDEEREERLAQFPFTVVLLLSYAEMDFANRWCWQQFGPAHGLCWDAKSNYPTCDITAEHAHEGKWMDYWLEKIEYDFGYNEWCFSQQLDRDRFLEFIPEINWGEKFPIQYST